MPFPNPASGQLQKLHTQLAGPKVQYYLPLGTTQIHLNPLLGRVVRLRFLGTISCIHCGRDTKKSFNQGYCFPCFKKLASCDNCIVRPQTCHYSAGTCREPEWARQHCLRHHYVYLANSPGIKVGITRDTQIPTRWIDQGAIQALPILRVENRLQSGLSEVILARHVADKTNWRAMLKGVLDEVDLYAARDSLLAQCATELDVLRDTHGRHAIQALESAEQLQISYPVLEYPTTISSLNPDKQPLIEGTLLGMKGQYLLLDVGVINMRNVGGYHLEFSVD